MREEIKLVRKLITDNFEKVCVITTPYNFKRHASIFEQLNHLGILDLVDIKISRPIDKTIECLKTLEISDYVKNFAEVSCAIEHLMIIQECLNSGIKNVLIIEDDAAFLEDLNLIASILKEIPKDADILRFYIEYSDSDFLGHPQKDSRSIWKSDLIRSFCTTCIGWMSEKAMRSYFDKQKDYLKQADDFLFSLPMSNYDLKSYCLYEMPLCIQNPKLESLIRGTSNQFASRRYLKEKNSIYHFK